MSLEFRNRTILRELSRGKIGPQGMDHIDTHCESTFVSKIRDIPKKVSFISRCLSYKYSIIRCMCLSITREYLQHMQHSYARSINGGAMLNTLHGLAWSR